MSTSRVMTSGGDPRIVDLMAIIARRRRAEQSAATQGAGASSPDELPASGARKAWVVAGVALALAVFTGTWVWQAGEAGRALRRLPAAERAALHARTMANLRDLCEPAPPRSLRAFCRDQAALVLELEECDDVCREIARRNLTVPTR